MSVNKGLWESDRKGVGAFYFDTSASAEGQLLNLFITVLEPTVYAFKQAEIDFVGIPTYDYSPFTVEFSATCSVLGMSNLTVSAYNWFFDSDRSSEYITCADSLVTHQYDGYSGKQYSVKCVVTFIDSEISATVEKTNYITSLGQKEPIKFGTDSKINLINLLPEYLIS